MGGPVAVNLEIFDDPIAQLVIWAALGAVLIAVGVYVIKKIRAEVVQQEPTANELLSKFRDLHSQGELSDAEFRTIKTTLAARLQDELKDDGQTG
jgi:hypothetical protein